MTGDFERIFGGGKPVIAMVHLGALPGSPLYDQERGRAGLVGAAAQDLAALQAAEFACSLDRRPLPDQACGTVFSSIPDAVLVSGQITGEAAALSDLDAVEAVVPDTPVLANTGVKHETVAEVLKLADGCIVGSSLKLDGNTWNAVDPERAAEFMRLARAAGGG